MDMRLVTGEETAAGSGIGAFVIEAAGEDTGVDLAHDTKELIHEFAAHLIDIDGAVVIKRQFEVGGEAGVGFEGLEAAFEVAAFGGGDVEGFEFISDVVEAGLFKGPAVEDDDFDAEFAGAIEELEVIGALGGVPHDDTRFFVGTGEAVEDDETATLEFWGELGFEFVEIGVHEILKNGFIVGRG
jgi:hypothetical protein